MARRLGTLDPAPPRNGSSDGGGGGGWVWLVTAKNVFEAEILKGLLESAGVPVMGDGFDSTPFAWMYPAGNPNVPVKLFVPAALLDAARMELIESSYDAAENMSEGRALEADVPPARRGRHGWPLWIVLAAILTSLSLATAIVVELFGRGACDSRVWCSEQKPDSSTQCGAAPLTVKVRPACIPNR